MLRIIGGRHRGRRLRFPAGVAIRPTPDRVRETLFNWLQPRIVGARVLDLFAGSGALGLEALSRGAAAVTLVEKDPRAVATIRANVAVVDVPGAHVVSAPVARYLAGEPSPFDVVLADPPYDDPVDELLTVLAKGWAADVVVVERARRTPAPAWPAPLRPWKERTYGDTVLHFGALHHTSPDTG